MIRERERHRTVPKEPQRAEGAVVGLVEDGRIRWCGEHQPRQGGRKVAQLVTRDHHHRRELR